MTGCDQLRRGALALAAALACLSGCEHFPTSGLSARSPAEVAAADLKVVAGRMMEERGDTAQALEAYKEAVRRDPTRADAALAAARLLDAQGQFADALAYYKKAQKAQPNNPDVSCNLGYSLYLQGQWREAEEALRRSLALHADHAKAHVNLGLVLARTGRHDEALAEFRKGGCSEADAHNNLAFALALQHNFPEARAHYERALAHEEASAAARLGLEALNAIAARAEKMAEGDSRAVLLREPQGPQTQTAEAPRE